MDSAAGPQTLVVLVVEDEPLIRMLAVDIVQEAGFDAIEAANADEAMRLLESRSDIGVVFTDIDMPGSLNGVKLASKVRDRWPPIGIIVTSGHCLSRDVQLPERGIFMPKPYRMADIAALLRRMATPAR